MTETCVSTAKHGAKYLLILNWHEGNIPSLAIAAEALHRDARHERAHRAGLLRRRGAVRPRLRRPHPRRRDRGAGGARAPARPRAPRPHRLFVRPRARPQDGQAAPHAQLPAGADRHPLDRADRLVRQPAARHRREGRTHARPTSPTRSPRRRREIFRQLDAVQGGTAEIKQPAAGGADGAAAEAIGGEAARPARPHLARAGVGRDRLAA